MIDPVPGATSTLKLSKYNMSYYLQRVYRIQIMCYQQMWVENNISKMKVHSQNRFVRIGNILDTVFLVLQ